uniref:DNA-directed RNA polymerase n=1 Tax=viral metagenome TaxID=1070528 RepID=A0A6C0HKN7_9ZZZZ
MSIVGVQFGITSPEEILRRSVVEVITDKTHQGSNPVPGGVFDSRLGVIESGKVCPTCKHTNLQCQGHFGHITLARPVYLYQFLDFTIKVLNTVCLNCSSLYVVASNADAEMRYLESELAGMDRLATVRKDTVNAIAKASKNGKQSVSCPTCETQMLHKIVKVQGTVCSLHGQQTGPGATPPEFVPLQPEMVLRCFQRLTDTSIRILGFDPRYSRPAWMVCTVLAVPPLTVRPPVVMDDNQRMDDDLSHKLIDIVRSNQKLREQIDRGQPRDYIEKMTAHLEYDVATYVDNDIKGMPPAAQRSGRPLKTLKSRLGAKTGRVRGNLMGKRVDFSARSVITPDANIDVDELGVPEEIASNLTKPEIVTPYNRDRLMMYVRNGVRYPGAKSVFIKDDKRMISLRYVNPDMIDLREGDVVHRHMIDGDYVLFNRQPSLHKGSMECHRVKVLPYSTFRLNVSATKPYNADFDGDEMNLHLPQSIAAETELLQLASVLRLIISPRENAPIIQMVQDTLTGAFRISNPKVRIPEFIVMNIMAKLRRPLASFDKTGLDHTGMDVISAAFPLMNFNELVTVENGRLTKGLLRKGAFNKTSQGVLHVLFNDYGPQRCGQFINEIQAIVTKFNTYTGFSTGASDLVANTETAEFVATTLADGRRRVQEILTDVHAGRFVNVSGRSDGDELENQINNTLKDISAKVSSRVTESLPRENRLVQMVDSGAKGSDLNIAQMMSLLGQQIVDGKRVQYTLQDRSLPHFTKFDDGIESRGFVESSFVQGLRPAEYFFHAMGGREGLIDTAVKSVTGDTPIIIVENGVSKYVRIGDWIDGTLAANADKVNHFEERQMEHLYVDGFSIPTTDHAGAVTWGDVVAVTRHDPGEHLYEIITQGGRRVIVTESKSLLIWNPDTRQLEETSTPSVKVGDCTPVTMNLCSPPVVTKRIHMEEIFAKSEYVYGTDFNVAARMMNEAMEGREHIPAGWWEAHNGKEFTLPYTKKALLMRASKRSSNVRDGVVYPFHATRTCGEIPAVFELDYDNGVFIGLFLAEGNACIQSGSVQITNLNENVQNAVIRWFAKHNITYRKTCKVNHIGGRSEAVVGSSRMLAQFLTRIVGHGAAEKYVPDAAFTASDEFVRGLLSGYISGDGCVSHNSVEASSASRRLTEGISMLCSRLGMFAKVFTTQLKDNNLHTETIAPSHRLSIRAQWARRFAEVVTLVDDRKQRELKTMAPSELHRNFEALNDVVLDPIAEIRKMGVEEYPKVYDLTIPTTLNFGLANGLQVRDTSDTGYIQRQMMKTMEDMHVAYDGTIRNNVGIIIQYKYGEDGVDSTQVESQPINLALMTMEEIYRNYALNPADLADVMTNTESVYPDLVDELLRDRDMLVREVFSFQKKDSVLAPVHLKRLVEKYRNPYSTKTDLTPSYVVDELTKLIKEPFIAPNRLFHCLVRFYLAPRRTILEYRMTVKIFDELLKEVRFRYNKGQVHPGEMVGALAAQSIGEPTTQLTLNSVDWDERIIISKNGLIMTPTIGEFVDTYCAEHADKVQHLDRDQKYADLDDDGWQALSCDETGRMVWTKLEAVTHHPVVNEDGSSTILKVELESGRVVKATKGKSFLTVQNGVLVATNGSELKVGSELPIAASIAAEQLPQIAAFSLREILPATEWLYGSDVQSAVYQKYHTREPAQIPETWVLDSELGFFFGAYLAEGMSNRTQVMITNNDDAYIQRVRDLTDKWNVGTHVVRCEKTIENTGICGTSQSLIIHSTMLAKVMTALLGRTSHEKTMPDWVLQAPDTFVKSLVDGYIGGDGSVSLKDTITYSSVSQDLILKMNAIMARYGIYTSTSSYTPALGKFKTVSKQFATFIPAHYTYAFANTFKVSIASKQERLNTVVDHGFRRSTMQDVVLDKVKSIEEVEPIKGRVYDLTVAGTRNFTGLNLVCHRDTFHSAGTVKAGATQGVPRIKELLSVSRNPKNPLSFVYLKPEMSTSLDFAIMMIREFQKTTLRDITKSVRMYYDPYPLTTDTKIAEDREILQTFQAFSVENDRACASPWIMRLEFDETEMAARNVNDMVSIRTAIETSGVNILQCVYSDANTPDKLVMRIVFPAEAVKNLLTLRFMEEKVLDIIISGIEGVGRVYQRDVNSELLWDEATNAYACKKQHVLDVEGAGNLYDLLAHPNVDATRTFSNDIREILDCFGIEAARHALYDEFWEILKVPYVNYHHMSVLLDAMTYQGRLISVDRFGMGKHDNGVLAKSSFEETSKILFNAAVSSAYDPMQGVSANIMFGQKPPCGTGLVDVLLDETRLPEGGADDEDGGFIDYREQAKARVETLESAAPVGSTECKMEDLRMW